MCLFSPKRLLEFLADGMYAFFVDVKKVFQKGQFFFINQTKISAMYLQKFFCYILPFVLISNIYVVVCNYLWCLSFAKVFQRHMCIGSSRTPCHLAPSYKCSLFWSSSSSVYSSPLSLSFSMVTLIAIIIIIIPLLFVSTTHTLHTLDYPHKYSSNCEMNWGSHILSEQKSILSFSQTPWCR